MNIVVCIKQVPASSDVKIDPVTGVLIRDGNNTKMNPYDLYGIETALRIKEQNGATIKTISMGPGPAKAVLEESLWMGCDEALLISDRKFGGADVVATAYTISQGIKKLGDFDLMTVKNDNAALADILTNMGIVLPTTEDKEYAFPVGSFFEFISPMGATTSSDGHVFNIMVTDANGKSKTSKLSVKVTE